MKEIIAPINEPATTRVSFFIYMAKACICAIRKNGGSHDCNLPIVERAMSKLLSRLGAHFPHMAYEAGYVTPCMQNRGSKTFKQKWRSESATKLTSKNPSSTRRATNSQTLFSAATVVKRVRMAVITTPTPYTHFPPTLCASRPPGIWVIRYP